MSQKALSIRKIKEVLRLRYDLGLLQNVRRGLIVGMPGFHSAKGISARGATRGAAKTHGSVQKLTHGCGQAAHGFRELRIRLVRDDDYI